MADSRSLVGGIPVSSIGIRWLSLQLSFEPRSDPAPSRSSRIGSCSALGTPNGVKEGPMARMSALVVPVPVIIKPPIKALSPVPTASRVEILTVPFAAMKVIRGKVPVPPSPLAKSCTLVTMPPAMARILLGPPSCPNGGLKVPEIVSTPSKHKPAGSPAHDGGP